MNLNKAPYNKVYLDYGSIANGGEFEVLTGRLPNKLFMQGLEKPTSRITDSLIVPDPYVVAPAKAFTKPMDIEIKCADAAAKIYYTLDGSTPTSNSTLYTSPINIASNTRVKAIAFENGKSSFVDEASFNKRRDDVKITILNKYLPNYADEGDQTLVNGIRGKVNWRLGNWQGYEGVDLAAVIDMGQVKPVKQVSLGTLQDTRSWIVFPQYVQYWLSDDGVNYKLAATVNTKVAITDLNVQLQDFTAVLNTNARYIKVFAKQYGALPDWHESKGEASYIFADEITVE
jgi:hypothetical protein